MKTRSYHISNFGKFAPSGHADSQGYVTRHDSERYEKASAEQLDEWLESPNKYVRAAAATEIAERKLAEWRKQN